MGPAGLANEALAGGGGGVELEEVVLLAEGVAVVALARHEETGLVGGEVVVDG